jgi:hypothetical protein
MNKFIIGAVCGVACGFGTSTLLKTRVDSNFLRNLAIEQPAGYSDYYTLLVKQQTGSVSEPEKESIVKKLGTWSELLKSTPETSAPEIQ